MFDLRDAIRSLRRDRVFAATVIVTLAVTIGVTTAVFSIVNSILLKPLSYPEPERLVSMREVWRELADRVPTLEVNERHFEYWRAQSRTFDAMAQYNVQPANLTSGGPATQIAVARSSGSLFNVLGDATVLGRPLAPPDDAVAAAAVVVLGNTLWRQRFSANPEIVGEAIVLDGRPFTVIGVLSPAFRLPGRDQLIAAVDAMIPLRLQAGWVGDHNHLAVGRLKSGVTLEQAAAELDVLQGQVAGIALAESGQRITLAARIAPLEESIVGRSRRGLLLLLAAMVSVLAIACSNLTNLALIRAMARARDGAIRSALGAGRGRLIAKAIFDHALLAVAGGALGLGIASLALRLFVFTAPIDLPRIGDVAIDARVVMFAAGVSLLTGLLVSILPVWHLSRRDPQAVLRVSSPSAGQAPGGIRARSLLTAAQIAIAVTLLTVTALLGVSLVRVLETEQGFNAERIVAIPVALPAARYADREDRVAVHERILDAIRVLPGVRAISSTSLLPMRGEGQVNFVIAAGTTVPREQRPSANFRLVTPDYFRALELPIRRGRSFTGEEQLAAITPAVISESVAARLWPNDDALGKEFSRGIDGEPGFLVVGIATDARTTSIERTQPLMVYVPYSWQSRQAFSLLVKTAADAMSLVPAVRTAIERVDPEVAIGETRLLTDLVDASVAGRRYQARLFVVFGVASLLIATLGVYAVTAYSLSKRRREMNIRVALGARTADVIALFMKQTAVSVVPGLGAGVLGALAVGGTVASLLYEVAPRDPFVLIAVAITVGIVAIATSLVATRAGLSIDPAAALREE